MSLPVNQIIQGDCRDTLPTLPDNSVDCCVTSPPYWGLRDYGVDGQLGLEKTPQEYVQGMVDVFTQVYRVLKPEGTLWLNLGDSYASGGRGINEHLVQKMGNKQASAQALGAKRPAPGLKDKDLVGIPWRVAFALQEYGWYLRQDIIWHKPNPMPESVRDRCTKAHEYIFLLSKSRKYYFDQEAIKEESIDPIGKHRGGSLIKAARGEKGDSKVAWHNHGGSEESLYSDGKANKRSVWSVATRPYKDAHFATFPPELITPCILAGCPKDGIVLDPFMGSGTTAEVAYKLGRNYIGCELNPAYIELGRAEAAKQNLTVSELKQGQMRI